MTTHKTASLAWLAVSTLAALPACNKSEPPPPPAPAAPAPSFVDHVGPNELLEGETKAFGLPLPRGFAPQNRLTYQVTGEIVAPPEAVANYFRARVGDGKITMGSTSTTFSHVRPRAEPTRTLDIRVEKVKNGTQVVVADVIGLDGPPPANQEDALKKAGLGPTGRPSPQMQ